MIRSMLYAMLAVFTAHTAHGADISIGDALKNVQTTYQISFAKKVGSKTLPLACFEGLLRDAIVADPAAPKYGHFEKSVYSGNDPLLSANVSAEALANGNFNLNVDGSYWVSKQEARGVGFPILTTAFYNVTNPLNHSYSLGSAYESGAIYEDVLAAKREAQYLISFQLNPVVPCSKK